MEMEPQTTTCNDLEKKKFVVKMGGGAGGGGGIGAIILMSGVLATAAFASAFVVTKKGWGSGKDRRRRHQNPPPELNEQTEVDDPDTSSDEHKYTSGEATKQETEKDDGSLISTESLILDDKLGIEINGKTPEIQEQIPSSDTPKEGNVDVLDGSGIIKGESQSSDETLRFDLKNEIHEEKTQLIEEDIMIDISKESNNFQQEEIVVREASSDGEIQGKPIEEEHTEICCDEEESEVGVNLHHIDEEKSLNIEVKMEEKELEGCSSDDGEIIEETKEDVVELRNGGNQEAINNNNPHLETIYSENDGQNDMLETPVIEQENVNGVEEKEGVICIETAEITLIEEGEKDEKTDRFDRGIVPEKCGLQIIVDEGLISSEEVILPEVTKDDGENEEIAEMDENETLVKDKEEDVERNITMEVAEEMVFTKDIGVKEEEISGVNENENILLLEADVENTIAGEDEIATEKHDGIMKMGEDNIKDYNDEADEIDLSDEVEESSVGTGDSSMESNEDAVWPLNLEVNLIDQEVQGKIQEDKAINKDSTSFEVHQVKKELNPENVPIMADNSKSKMSFPANPTWRMIIIGIFSVLSSLSCSWFFGLSFVKLCLILFLSMVLSEIHGY